MNEQGRQQVAKALGGILEHEVCDARERMANSGSFRSAPQLASFLNYIVKTTLLGRQHEIKGYTIAVEALGRPDDFDPVADPIVRVEAGRLRRAIDAYYAGEGAGDPVRIVVERGSYVPQFVRVPVEASAGSGAEPLPAEISAGRAETVGEAASSPGVAPALASALATRVGSVSSTSPKLPASGSSRAFVLALLAVAVLAAGLAGYGLRRDSSPLSQDARAIETPMTSVGRRQPTVQVMLVRSPDDEITASLGLFERHLSDALSRFDDFMVLKASASLTGIAAVQPTYRVEFSAEPNSAGGIVANLRLFDVANSRVVFSGENEFPRSMLEKPDLIREIVRLNAVRIGQPYGLIYADLRANGTSGTAVQCIVKTYDYWTTPSAARHAEVRDCLEATVKADPLYHPAWSLLAMIHLDEYRIGYNPRPGSALDRARKASQQAVALSPESARALQALMAVLTVSGETEEALKVGFQAVRRNPFDTDILADLGARLTQAGRAREGRPLLLRAAEVNRARPVWHEFYLYLSAREVGDVEGARSALKALELVEAPLALLAQAIAASDRGARGDSMDAMRRLATISPVFGDDAGEFLDRAFFARNVRAMLLEALVRGGLSDLNKG